MLKHTRNSADTITLRVVKFTPRGAEEWTRGEIKRLRKYLATVHGNGPRAQQVINAKVANVLGATKSERAAIRKEATW